MEEELPHSDVSREAMAYMQKQQADWLKASKGILERHRLQPRVAKTVRFMGCYMHIYSFIQVLIVLFSTVSTCSVTECFWCVLQVGCVDKQHEQFRRLLQKDASASKRLVSCSSTLE